MRRISTELADEQPDPGYREGLVKKAGIDDAIALDVRRGEEPEGAELLPGLVLIATTCFTTQRGKHSQKSQAILRLTLY